MYDEDICKHYDWMMENLYGITRRKFTYFVVGKYKTYFFSKKKDITFRYDCKFPLTSIDNIRRAEDLMKKELNYFSFILLDFKLVLED